MWLFTIYGFYSTACAAGADGAPDPDTVMVRARKKRHLQNLKGRFPAIQGEIVTTKDTDYGYRVILPKAEWVSILGELAQEQSWSNFKNEAAQFQGGAHDDYIEALHRVWSVMHRTQDSE